MHIQKKDCASCGYPRAKMRGYEWGEKAKRYISSLVQAEARFLRGSPHLELAIGSVEKQKKADLSLGVEQLELEG